MLYITKKDNHIVKYEILFKFGESASKLFVGDLIKYIRDLTYLLYFHIAGKQVR